MRKHGHAVGGKTTPTYRSWMSMNHRCNAPNYPDYAYYGGRGIKICERWESFSDFLSDMGERPSGTSLDRINNDGNYEPTNCRWATHVQQTRNTRLTKLTAEQVSEIQSMFGGSRLGHLSAETIAQRYGVTTKYVHRLWSRRRRAVDDASSRAVRGRLSDETIAVVRGLMLAGVLPRELVVRYGISRAHLYRIKHGQHCGSMSLDAVDALLAAERAGGK